MGWPRVTWVVTTSCERYVVIWTRRSWLKVVMCKWDGSHVKKMITCEPGCGCGNWLVMFSWGHMWTGCGRVNEVVTCKQIRSNSGRHVWTRWSGMDRVRWCERGRRVNWVRCDTFYFGLLIRHLERAKERLICMQTCRSAFYALETLTTHFLILLQCSFKRDGHASMG